MQTYTPFMFFVFSVSFFSFSPSFGFSGIDVCGNPSFSHFSLMGSPARWVKYSGQKGSGGGGLSWIECIFSIRKVNIHNNSTLRRRQDLNYEYSIQRYTERSALSGSFNICRSPSCQGILANISSVLGSGMYSFETEFDVLSLPEFIVLCPPCVTTRAEDMHRISLRHS